MPYELADEEENREFIEHINECINILNSIDDDSKKIFLYPYLFFSIFVKFQNVVYNLFDQYAIGKSSSKGYTPVLKHKFKDEKELHVFLGSKNKEYIEYDDRIDKLSQYIFDDNIFDKLNMLSPLSYSKLLDIRNYIAHESVKSLNRLIDGGIINNGSKLSDYFIKKKKGTAKTYFEMIVQNLKNFTDFLINPNS